MKCFLFVVATTALLEQNFRNRVEPMTIIVKSRLQNPAQIYRFCFTSYAAFLNRHSCLAYKDEHMPHF
jgi:hypothetical protein